MTTTVVESGVNPVLAQAGNNVNMINSDAGVSWPAVFAGATVAAALSLVLFVLGTGLGLSMVSPWTSQGVDAQTFGISSILGVTLTSVAASAVGGYVAGRLRGGWQDINGDEVFFRDTAHGLLAWGISTLAIAVLFTSVFATIVSGAARTGAMAVTGAATIGSSAAMAGSDQSTNPVEGFMNYTMDSLFRSQNSNNSLFQSDNREAVEAAIPELGRILVNAVTTGALPQEDEEYAATVIARSTGITQQEAAQRIDEAFVTLQNTQNAALEAADEARAASAYLSLWMVVSLLIGAFAASLSAVHGGRQRDL